MKMIKTKCLVTVLTLAVVCFNPPTFAQVLTDGFMRGDRSLALSGSGSSDRDFDSTGTTNRQVSSHACAPHGIGNTTDIPVRYA